ncbi:thiamine-phosphate kinase [Helicobacter sp. MIT 21-1697]|uniref:thiamine-phosphate kinase n=1 Tax=Helicobacter sp. MIT 21-1697 TaxID=2993733 RepID=UPI00224B8AFE|nr:thiamine-phosphate kinase [Helicobacter sp. MIT 21-1697]MCX2716628.1 thiamine-phosphate kinase [Helicobacter sp. MIT 21-1697]
MIGFDRESFFIHTLQSEGITEGIGDDCCVFFPQDNNSHHPRKAHIKAHINPKAQQKANVSPFVVGMDSFCEGVHFLAHWFSPYELAFKAFLVNYSDIVAMNATPAYAMLSIGLPRYWAKAEIKDCIRGIGDFCRKYNVKLIGGDTISTKDLQIHITFFGLIHKHTLYRDKIPAGSVLFYTCDKYPQHTITQSYKVLKTLLHPPKNKHLRAKGRFLSPRIRARFIADCARFLKGGMDISDGILSDISKLSAINKLHFKSNMPLFAPHLKPLLYSGESYEMLIAIAPKDSLKLKRIALRHRIKVCKIGQFTRKKYILPPIKYWH